MFSSFKVFYFALSRQHTVRFVICGDSKMQCMMAYVYLLIFFVFDNLNLIPNGMLNFALFICTWVTLQLCNLYFVRQ